MKVRMIVAISGERDGVAWPAIGDEKTVPDVEGAELCAAGYAEPVAVPAPVERAVAKKSEKR